MITTKCCEQCSDTEINHSTESIEQVCGNGYCSCHTATTNYERISHFHCWKQKQPSACGIPLEKHEQCCLCDLKVPTTPDWESRFDEEFRAVSDSGHAFVGRYGGKNGAILPVEMEEIKELIRTLVAEAEENERQSIIDLADEVALKKHASPAHALSDLISLIRDRNPRN